MPSACLSASLQPTTMSVAIPEEPVKTPMIVPRLGYKHVVQVVVLFENVVVVTECKLTCLGMK